MKSVVQRVSQASVSVDGQVIGAIETGLSVLLGFTHEDTKSDVDWAVEKIIHLRVFEDDAGKMNLSLQDVGGSLLLISQFTLYGDCAKGRRPSFVQAMQPEKANTLYEYTIEKAQAAIGRERVATGQFGAHMHVSLCNDGPVTLIV